MYETSFKFHTANVNCFFGADFAALEKIPGKRYGIVITDENVNQLQISKYEGWKKIVIKPGEQFKQQATVDSIIDQLIVLGADRDTILIGVGGGVVTDITGYVAATYMRGIRCCLVPTTILAMVDACIGGKNGVDVGNYKNLVGTVKHPEFLIYDYSLLQTLPMEEWINGFAEIIKHACIKDEALFKELENSSIEAIGSSAEKVDNLIQRNVMIKYNVVSNDETEQGERRLLNFGHTIGHAIENICNLPHGHAVSIGMVAACTISEEINNFNSSEKSRVVKLLRQYQLPVSYQFDKKKAWELLLHDKKKSGNTMNFVLLNNIGNASVTAIPLEEFEFIYNQLF